MTTTDAAPMARESTEQVDEALAWLGRALKDQGYHFTTITPASHERVNRAGRTATRPR